MTEASTTSCLPRNPSVAATVHRSANLVAHRCQANGQVRWRRRPGGVCRAHRNASLRDSEQTATVWKALVCPLPKTPSKAPNVRELAFWLGTGRILASVDVDVEQRPQVALLARFGEAHSRLPGSGSLGGGLAVAPLVREPA